MKIKLYGVRGSIASGENTVRYGGNTACVSVHGEDGKRLIFDAGTGIRLLGEAINDHSVPLHLFFSHYHWDHIQGFPFFRPAYQAEQDIVLLSDHLLESADSILEQMADPHFPVPGSSLKANIRVQPIAGHKIDIGEFHITTLASNHPGGGCAYRVDSPQGSFAYITDNELFPPDTPVTSYEQWVEFVSGIDLLLHDAMYLDEEAAHIHGWGHSLISQALQLAVDAAVDNVILFHHDPERTDQQLDQIQHNSRQWAKEIGAAMKVYMAREGDVYRIAQGSAVCREKTDFPR